MATSSAIESPNAAPSLNRETLIALSEGKREPDWLRESRIEGWTAFQELPHPRWTKGIAQWWTTDVSSLNLSEIRPFVPATKSAEEAKSRIGHGRGYCRQKPQATKFPKTLFYCIAQITFIKKWPEFIPICHLVYEL